MERIAVLGLGRMGAAMARRFAARGHSVTGWSRSGRRIPGIDCTDDLATAVRDAEVVVLALFDGRACREVLARLADARPGAGVLVNTSTVSPADAADLVAEWGPDYVHAPVLGSIPAVESGTLQLLVAGTAPAVLEDLGQIHPVDDAATAAALKLAANAGLAGALGAVRDVLHQAAALGLSREQAVWVLGLGPLAGLVARKREELLGGAAQSQFTVSALAKDLGLLTTASGVPHPVAGSVMALAESQPDADIAAVALEPPVDPAVLAPLRDYALGHATGDPSHFRRAFLPTAHVEGLRDEAFVSWSLDDYCALFAGSPAPDEHARRRWVTAVEVHGTVATASMTLWHGADTFIDCFVLVRTGVGWRIANKVYDRRPAAPRRPT